MLWTKLCSCGVLWPYRCAWLKKIAYHGLIGVVALWFESYLPNKVQSGQISYKLHNQNIKNHMFAILPVRLCVLRGFILGLVLCLLFINDGLGYACTDVFGELSQWFNT